VQGGPKVLCDVPVALATEVGIIRGPLLQALVGRLLLGGRLVPLVAGGAAPVKVRIAFEELGVYQIALVEIFRPNWGRRTRSPLPFGGGGKLGLHHGLHFRFVPVAFHAPDGRSTGFQSRGSPRNETQTNCKRNQTQPHETSFPERSAAELPRRRTDPPIPIRPFSVAPPAASIARGTKNSLRLASG
jgi:hypothetical protein